MDLNSPAAVLHGDDPAHVLNCVRRSQRYQLSHYNIEHEPHPLWLLYNWFSMDEKGVQSFLIIFSVIAFLLALTVILLFAIFQKRKNKLLREQQDAENRYREEIIETQIEIKEETLRNISWELHDNIGQLLTLSKIQLQNADDKPERVQEASETIGQCLEELRSLSKLINPDTFSNLSLVEALQLEMERFNRMKYLKASLSFQRSRFRPR